MHAVSQHTADKHFLILSTMCPHLQLTDLQLHKRLQQSAITCHHTSIYYSIGQKWAEGRPGKINIWLQFRVSNCAMHLPSMSPHSLRKWASQLQVGSIWKIQQERDFDGPFVDERSKESSSSASSRRPLVGINDWKLPSHSARVANCRMRHRPAAVLKLPARLNPGWFCQSWFMGEYLSKSNVGLGLPALCQDTCKFMAPHRTRQ